MLGKTQFLSGVLLYIVIKLHVFVNLTIIDILYFTDDSLSMTLFLWILLLIETLIFVNTSKNIFTIAFYGLFEHFLPNEPDRFRIILYGFEIIMIGNGLQNLIDIYLE